MKKLLLVRHAKSSWHDLTLSDFERPLNKRGERDAPLMAKALRQAGHLPDQILSSPAYRARATAEIFSQILNVQNLCFDDSLYHASSSDLLFAIQQVVPATDTCMLVGHNPGITDVANLIGGPTIDNVPTCGMVLIELKCNRWQEVATNSGNIVLFHSPKKLRTDQQGTS